MPLSDTVFEGWINEAEGHQRLSDYRDYQNYYLGNFDDITLPDHIKEALGVDVAMHANFCRPIIDTKVEYICGTPIGLTVESTPETEAAAKEAEEWLYKVYKKNKLFYHNMIKTVRILSTKGDVFLKAILDDENGNGELHKRLKVRILKPENCFPKYATDDYEELELMAIKYYSYSSSGDVIWHAQVWYPDVLQVWDLSTTGTDDKQNVTDHEWTRVEDLENPFGVIPAIHIPNIINDMEFGISDLQVMTEMQDVFNKTITDMALTMDYQAFKRIFVLGATTKTGQRVDISPGAVHHVPNENAKIEEIDAAQVTPFLDAMDKLKETICEVTQTPQIALGNIKGGVPSGYALRIHYQPLENKSNETISLLQGAFQELNQILFRIAVKNGMPDWTGLETKLQFTSGLPIDKKATVETHEKQIKMGTLSVETAMEEEGVPDTDAEKAKIQAESFDVFGGTERAVQEATALAKSLEGEQFFAEAAPGEVSERERELARETPAIG